MTTTAVKTFATHATGIYAKALAVAEEVFADRESSEEYNAERLAIHLTHDAVDSAVEIVAQTDRSLGLVALADLTEEIVIMPKTDDVILVPAGLNPDHILAAIADVADVGFHADKVAILHYDYLPPQGW